MKTLGLIGGMSWESSAVYYQLINKMVGERQGGLHSVRCILFSVDFQVIENFQSTGNWQQAGEYLAGIAARLESAGADCVILCTNTMHKVCDVIKEAVSIPVLHIVDVTAAAIVDSRVLKVGLFGTRFTMEEEFFKQPLQDLVNIDVSVPLPQERHIIDRIIYAELCQGEIKSDSKAKLVEIANRMYQDGTDGLILGCTELGLLLADVDVPQRLFDTTQLHAKAAVNWYLSY